MLAHGLAGQVCFFRWSNQELQRTLAQTPALRSVWRSPLNADTLPMPATMQSLAELLELPEDVLRRLVQVGEPPDRLQAAWAMAMRLGVAAAPEIERVAASEIPQGLRQQLVVVLAGLGERHVVGEIARSDPHESVRAVATSYTIRTAASSQDADIQSFARGKLRSDTSEVRLAVLREVLSARLVLDVSAIRPLLHATNTRERSAALLAVLTLASHDRLAVDALTGLVAESDRDNEQLIAGLGRTEAVSLVRALAGEQPATIASVLRLLRGGRLELGWDDLSFLWARPEVEIANALLRTTRTCPPASALPWLVHAYLAASTKQDEDDGLDACRSYGWFYITTLIAPGNVVTLSSEDRHALGAAVQLRRAAVAENLTASDLDDDFFDDRDYLLREAETLSTIEAILREAG